MRAELELGVFARPVSVTVCAIVSWVSLGAVYSDVPACLAIRFEIKEKGFPRWMWRSQLVNQKEETNE